MSEAVTDLLARTEMAVTRREICSYTAGYPTDQEFLMRVRQLSLDEAKIVLCELAMAAVNYSHVGHKGPEQTYGRHFKAETKHRMGQMRVATHNLKTEGVLV